MDDFKSKVAMLFVVSIGILIFGLGKIALTYNFMRTAKETEAEIVKVQEVRERTRTGYSTRYIADLKYTIDNVSYTKNVTLYKKDMAKSKSITIQYNPKKPTDIRVEGDIESKIYFYTGLTCLVISFCAHIYGKRKYGY